MLDSAAIDRAAVRVLCAAVVLLGIGCTASISASTAPPRVLYSYPVANVDSPPPRLQERARVHYRGRPAYLVGSRWYYPANGDWSTSNESQKSCAGRVYSDNCGSRQCGAITRLPTPGDDTVEPSGMWSPRGRHGGGVMTSGRCMTARGRAQGSKT